MNPVAALFGANAAGKTTFVWALQAFSGIITDPPRPSDPMPYEPFALNPSAMNEPSGFELLFSVGDVIYEYIIRFDVNQVVEERLTRFLSNREEDIFERAEGSFKFSVFDSLPETLSDDRMQARVLLESVPPKVPLASFASEANLSHFPAALRLEELSVVRRFAESIVVVPAGTFDFAQQETFALGWRDVITQIDAGITGVATESVEVSALGLSPAALRELTQRLETFHGLPRDLELASGRYTVMLDNGEMKAEKVLLEHSAGSYGNRSLKWWDESDGTHSATRLLGLVSTLTTPGAEITLIIDELDRSFHTELSRALVGGFLATSSSESRAQLIFTTHDLLLMDPEMLRRDEIWIVEKDRSGQTQASALSEFEGPRKVTDLRKSYLRGRFGGVPSIRTLEFNRGE